MVIDLKLCRFENVPWGFRLIGGSDFDIPLTVVKVTEGSIAEEAGMKVDDIIVRINDEAASKLSHNEAHELISKCGNIFFFGILREGEEPVIANTENLQIIEEYLEPSEASRCQSKSPAPEITEMRSESDLNNNQNSEEKLSDDQIAELISGESEVLKDHNVIGVNFNRIFPKPGVCMSSDVLRQLNDEAIKTKIEREKEKRKWTTFMQKPDRPIPKSKKEIETERLKQINAYKVVIKKQPKPRVAPDRTPTPPPIPAPEPEPVIEEPIEEIEDDSKPLTDNDVPDLEPLDSENTDINVVAEDNEQLEWEQPVQENQETTEEEETKEKEETPEPEAPIIEKTEEELILEQQLADVQKQLMALSSLPSTIQATLDAVTKQLAELLPTFKLQPPVAKIETIEEVNSCGDNNSQCESDYKSEDIEETYGEDQNAASEENKTCDVEVETEQNEIVQEVEPTEPEKPSEPTVEEIEQARQLEEEYKEQEELNYKKQKDNGLMEELQQRLIKDRTPKRPSRPFGPLVPQQRPLILPGGRRWRTPKDAFNEDFIAETLSSQAELIVGHTLGSTFESPLLGYDKREYNSTSLAIQLEKKVNFLKYQKPEKKIDLDKSEVYKVIHHLDRQPKHGIEVRPAKVMAEEDIRNRVQTPISCG